jgi:hypothetical protein
VRLLPVDDPQVPLPTPWFVLEKPTGCVAAVEVEGSSFARMANRARDRVNHLLRAMRIAQSADIQDGHAPAHGTGRHYPSPSGRLPRTGDQGLTYGPVRPPRHESLFYELCAYTVWQSAGRFILATSCVFSAARGFHS